MICILHMEVTILSPSHNFIVEENAKPSFHLESVNLVTSLPSFLFLKMWTWTLFPLCLRLWTGMLRQETPGTPLHPCTCGDSKRHLPD